MQTKFISVLALAAALLALPAAPGRGGGELAAAGIRLSHEI